MILPLLIIPIVTLSFILWFVGVNRVTGPQTPRVFLSSGTASVVKLLTLISFNVSLFYGAYLWKSYPCLTASSAVYPSSSWFELYHSLGLPFILLSTFVLAISLLTAWYAAVDAVLFTALLLLVEVCLIGAFSCTNLFLFLLFFEASALPIFILVVYCGSPRRERLKASYYFLFFTLYGSISLLLLIVNIYALNHLSTVDVGPQQTQYVLWALLFVAFAVKIPLFPFHLWLPYAHVEASTSTSIVLAALMLKLGGYGVLKFMLPLFSMETHLFFRPFILAICVAGVVYGGFAALRQIDLKRQIAFSSISHMSFATAGIFTFTEVGIKGAVYLMLSHGLTSIMLFYLVGVLSDRYHTRSVLLYGGLMGAMPLFSGFLIFASLANVGFPGTSGFLPEFYVLVAVVSSNPGILLCVLVGMLLTTISSLVLLLRLLFGHVKAAYSRSSWADLTKLEFFILSMLSFWVLILGLYDILYNI